MRDYSKGKIYSIRFYDNDSLIYIGSTIQTLKNRFYKHKEDNTTSIYKYIQEQCNDNWSCCYMYLIIDYPCNTAEELEKEEGEFQRLFRKNPYYQLINKCIAGRTTKEWIKETNYNEKRRDDYKNNINNIKDKFAESKKKYYENYKNIILEKNKKYRDENKDKIKEQKKEYQKEYYEKIKEKQKEIIKCDCGCEITKKNLTRHKKSLKHQAYIQTLQ